MRKAVSLQEKQRQDAGSPNVRNPREQLGVFACILYAVNPVISVKCFGEHLYAARDQQLQNAQPPANS
jgi:hypothetical protein